MDRQDGQDEMGTVMLGEPVGGAAAGRGRLPVLRWRPVLAVLAAVLAGAVLAGAAEGIRRAVHPAGARAHVAGSGRGAAPDTAALVPVGAAGPGTYTAAQVTAALGRVATPSGWVVTVVPKNAAAAFANSAASCWTYTMGVDGTVQQRGWSTVQGWMPNRGGDGYGIAVSVEPDAAAAWRMWQQAVSTVRDCGTARQVPLRYWNDKRLPAQAWAPFSGHGGAGQAGMVGGWWHLRWVERDSYSARDVAGNIAFDSVTTLDFLVRGNLVIAAGGSVRQAAGLPVTRSLRQAADWLSSVLAQFDAGVLAGGGCGPSDGGRACTGGTWVDVWGGGANP